MHFSEMWLLWLVARCGPRPFAKISRPHLRLLREGKQFCMKQPQAVFLVVEQAAAGPKMFPLSTAGPAELLLEPIAFLANADREELCSECRVRVFLLSLRSRLCHCFRPPSSLSLLFFFTVSLYDAEVQQRVLFATACCRRGQC